jgi:uncharacterized protein
MNKTSRLLKTCFRCMALFAGFFIIANGIVFIIHAGLGVNPWDVLHLGISYHTGLSLGQVIQAVGLLLVVVSYALKVRLYIGTLLNMIFIGLFVDVVNNMGYVPAPSVIWLRLALYLAGVAVIGFGIALYISANLGAGPRDSLMLALTKATSLRVGVIRTIMEVSVTVIGYFLGGPLGVGTVLFALMVGWFMEMGFSLINLVKKSGLYRSLWQGLPEQGGVLR